MCLLIESPPLRQGEDLGGVFEYRRFDNGIDRFRLSHRKGPYQKVEVAGVEPASKQGARMLSTRLFCD